ncbi:hypothetical protein CHU98_g6751 [Xylaria longipes]|nr:hypothetical protein CHU98_g6751 [Xylaria longipes]
MARLTKKQPNSTVQKKGKAKPKATYGTPRTTNHKHKHELGTSSRGEAQQRKAVDISREKNKKDSDSDSGDDQEWSVRHVSKARLLRPCRGTREEAHNWEYLVHWSDVGDTSYEPTWEPTANLTVTLVHAFWARAFMQHKAAAGEKGQANNNSVTVTVSVEDDDVHEDDGVDVHSHNDADGEHDTETLPHLSDGVDVHSHNDADGEHDTETLLHLSDGAQDQHQDQHEHQHEHQHQHHDNPNQPQAVRMCYTDIYDI